MTPIKFTPTEVRLMQKLGDGKPHHGMTVLKPLLVDGLLNGRQALNTAVSRLRKKLLTRGETIICELKGTKICFRYVKLVVAQADPTAG